MACGCGHHYHNYAAPVLEPPPSQAVQSEAIQIVQQFVSALDKKDYAGADKLLTPQLRPQWSPSHVQSHLVKDGYWMLVGSHGWKYNEVESRKHGDEIVVHAQFYNDPQDMLYHTNFSLANAGNAWLINFILNPVQKMRLSTVHISGPASGSHH